MEQFDLVEIWLDGVSVTRSNSNRTREQYKSNFRLFCGFIGKTPNQISEEYKNSTDREFRERYTQYIQAFISNQFRKELSLCTISSRVGAIKSFFKYSNFPLGYVPTPRLRVSFHNRDITREEVKLILDSSRPREKAFFTVMAQSGLRPSTLCNLKYEHIKEDLTHNRIPCKIEVPQELAKGKYRSYFTFIGEEAVHYLQAYLNTRRNIADEDYLFSKEGTDEKTSPKSFSNFFARTVRKLKNKELMAVKQKQKNKPHDVRLYNLRKFFRKHAHEAGFELVQFWMGHIVNAGQDEHYRPTDVEFHRKRYAEKAMPFLRLETATPTETEKTIEELREQLKERDKEINALEGKMTKLQPLVDLVNSYEKPEDFRRTLDFIIDGLTESMQAPLKTLVEESWEMHAKEDYEKQKKKKAKE